MEAPERLTLNSSTSRRRCKRGLKIVDQYKNYLSILFLPFFGTLYFILFPAKRFNYAESLMAAVYLHAHLLLLVTVLSLPLLFYNSIEDFAVIVTSSLIALLNGRLQLDEVAPVIYHCSIGRWSS